LPSRCLSYGKFVVFHAMLLNVLL